LPHLDTSVNSLHGFVVIDVSRTVFTRLSLLDLPRFLNGYQITLIFSYRDILFNIVFSLQNKRTMK